MERAIHGDLSQRLASDTEAKPWEPSPSPHVLRKRLHRVGPAESGQVTSLVRYEPGSRFPAHDHPDGEEILVLEGVFSDEGGDWPAGTYLLNPEGFRHAPFSREGCLLFVKLRQYAGQDRPQLAKVVAELPWRGSARPGIAEAELYAQASHPEQMVLERWSPGAAPGAVTYPAGAEMLVLEGELEDELGRWPRHAWLRLPPGGHHHAKSPRGCTLYVKRGGVAQLRSV